VGSDPVVGVGGAKESQSSDIGMSNCRDRETGVP
jgi:hypothetical protein